MPGLLAPNCVHIAFLEHEGWDDPAIQHHLDAWPAPVRDVLRRQQEHQRAPSIAGVAAATAVRGVRPTAAS